jgi:hypothetical protein
MSGKSGGATGNRTRVQGFAVLCVTTPPSRLDAWEAGVSAVLAALSTGECAVDLKSTHCSCFLLSMRQAGLLRPTCMYHDARMSDLGDDRREREEGFQRRWWGYGTGLLVAYALSAPLIRYADPEALQIVGFLIAGVIFCGHAAMTDRPSNFTRVMPIATILAAASVAWIASSMLNHASWASRANDARCMAIQNDMLSAHPRRTDSPDLYQALGCRPQGYGGVSAPPTDRERKAGHSLPWGGYPSSR